ncbi:MAG: hypothetical protein CL927_20120 [Deltaproteobacteria bacterium]|nr:hypothetical protein [Deltaproteobacteria bacterium]HCH62367.1 hypothetical protein [Deltaproteobacteria bacterium]
MHSLRFPTWLLLTLAGCTVESSGKGEAPAAVDVPTEAEIEDYVSNGPIDLAPGSTLDGSALATEDDLTAPSWEDLTDVPEGILDGDDDSLAALSCAEEEWLSVASGAWVCTDTLPPPRIDASTAAEGDVLRVVSGQAEWTTIDDLLPSRGCSSGMVLTGDTCVEVAPRSAQTWRDAVLDCAAASLHLCTHAELLPGCVAGSTTEPVSGLEWAADRTDNGQAAMAFDQTYNCEATTESIGNQREYRCCTTAH